MKVVTVTGSKFTIINGLGDREDGSGGEMCGHVHYNHSTGEGGRNSRTPEDIWPGSPANQPVPGPL